MQIERWTLRETQLSSGQLSSGQSSGRSLPLSEAISRTFGSCDCGYELEEGEVASSFTKFDLGAVKLVRYRGRGTHWAARGAEHVRRNSSDDFLFYLPHNGKVTIDQRGHSSELCAGQIGFLSTRQAWRGKLEGIGHGSYESTHIVVPGAILRSRLPGIDELAGQAVEIGDSLQGIVSGCAHAVASCPATDDDLGKVLANIMLETLCSISEYAAATLPGGVRSRPLLRRGREQVQAYVLAHLTDPQLSVAMVAERLKVSQRYLHSLFEGTGWTVKAWIKHRRLLECRKAIQLPQLKHRTLTDIAYTWGFSDFSHFSRGYKDKFGRSPSQDRPAAPSSVSTAAAPARPRGACPARKS